MSRSKGVDGVHRIARAVGGVIVAAAAGAAAGQTSLNPSVSVGASYTNNVDYQGSADGRSDTTFDVGLMLPLRRGTRLGNMDLTYELETRWYDLAEEYDGTSHYLYYDQRWEVGRGGAWYADARYGQTNDRLQATILPSQVDPGPIDVETNPLVTERVRREGLEAHVDRSFRLGPRWGMSAGVFGGFVSVDDGSTAPVQDSDFYGASLGLDRLSSRRTTLGWDYEYGRSNPTEGLSEDVQRLYMRLEWEVSRRVTLEFRGGAFMHSPEQGDSETGALGWVDVRFNQGLTAGPFRFGFNLGVSPSSDDELVGTSLDTTASVVMSGVVVEPWNWYVEGGYLRREPWTGTPVPESEATFLRAAIERRFTHWMGFRLDWDSIDQSSDDPVLEGSFMRGTASVVFYPFASTRMARG